MCECPLAGYCATHQRHMDGGAHRLCRDVPGYYEGYQADLRRAGKSRGVGDTVENIAKATGVKAVVDAISEATGFDCGCTKHRDWLNAKFPYRKNSNSNS
jgi:hypothetical protein